MALPFCFYPGAALTMAQAAEQAQVSAPAPDFTLSTLEGKQISLSSLRGKVVFVNFWSIWCNPCRLEMPMMDSLYKRYKERGLDVIGVNIDRDSVASIEDFVKKHNLSFPVLLDRERKVMKVYRAHFLPTTVILSRGGIIMEKVVGVHDWSSPASQRTIDDLLKKQ
jgi:peroxiredoxin